MPWGRLAAGGLLLFAGWFVILTAALQKLDDRLVAHFWRTHRKYQQRPR